jgi:hypothetical protein
LLDGSTPRVPYALIRASMMARGENAMVAWVAVLLTCWLCALVAIPRKPRIGNEVEELVYARLLGREQRLVLLACVVTVATLLVLVLSLPRSIDPTLDAERHPPQVCPHDPYGRAAICYRRQPDGTWVEKAVQADGTWRWVGVVAAPPADAGADHNP